MYDVFEELGTYDERCNAIGHLQNCILGLQGSLHTMGSPLIAKSLSTTPAALLVLPPTVLLGSNLHNHTANTDPLPPLSGLLTSNLQSQHRSPSDLVPASTVDSLLSQGVSSIPGDLVPASTVNSLLSQSVSSVPGDLVSASTVDSLLSQSVSSNQAMHNIKVEHVEVFGMSNPEALLTLPPVAELLGEPWRETLTPHQTYDQLATVVPLGNSQTSVQQDETYVILRQKVTTLEQELERLKVENCDLKARVCEKCDGKDGWRGRQIDVGCDTNLDISEPIAQSIVQELLQSVFLMCEPLSEQPVKRKRGRPRKVSKVATSQVVGEGVLHRKRGRPPLTLNTIHDTPNNMLTLAKTRKNPNPMRVELSLLEEESLAPTCEVAEQEDDDPQPRVTRSGRVVKHINYHQATLSPVSFTHTTQHQHTDVDYEPDNDVTDQLASPPPWSTSKRKMGPSGPHKKFIRHVCSLCNKGFTHGRPFNRHIHKHQKNLMSCKKCKRECYNKAAFDTHQCLAQISKRKVRICRFCQKVFTSFKKLQNHLKVVHKVKSGDPEHFCQHCDKGFVKKLSLYVHYKEHAASKMVCLKCGTFCEDQQHYDQHMKQHEDNCKYRYAIQPTMACLPNIPTHHCHATPCQTHNNFNHFSCQNPLGFQTSSGQISLTAMTLSPGLHILSIHNISDSQAIHVPFTHYS